MENNTALEPERILYISECCAVVNKRAGEATEGAPPVAGPGIANLQTMLADALRKDTHTFAVPPVVLPQAAHRLDVPVSGCVVFALQRPALARLCGAFREGTEVEKRYWAIIETPAVLTIPESGELVHWLEYNPRKNKTTAHDKPVPAVAARKKAVLRYRIVGAGTNYLFMEIELVTGRRHQIRAQLAACNLHIKGDLKYGARRSEKTGGIRLHARSLSFPNPSGTGRVSVCAEPPQPDNLWLAFQRAVETRKDIADI